MKKDIFDKLRERLNEIHVCEELVKCANDPIYFLEQYATVQHPIKGAVPFTMYDYQKNLINSYHENRFNIVHGARQIGLSTTNALNAFSYTFLEPFKTVFIISDKMANACEVLYRIKFAYENLPKWLKDSNPLVVNNKCCLEFENGSKIFASATTGDATRGCPADLVILDNFAFVKYSLQKEVMGCIMPTIHDSGSLIISSCPATNSGMFKDIWGDAMAKKNAFVPHQFIWDVIPGRDDDFRNSMISTMGEARWRQEYECSFND